MADYNALLESSSYIKASREREIAELRSQLPAKDETIAEASEQCDEFEKRWKEEEGKVSDRDKIIAELRSELADLKQKSAAAEKEFPDMAEVYNRYKAKDPKAKMTFKEAMALLTTAQAMMEES